MGFFQQHKKDESGVALFMVVSAMMILSILVTEFSYVAQVNKRIAADGLDQLKARHMAKNAFKLALLRLKAYQEVQALAKQAGSKAPMREVQQIWSMPFAFPIPKQMLKLSALQKDAIDKFEKSSNLEGSFTMMIQSDSDKFNINSILPAFNPASAPSPAASASNSPADPAPTPTPSPSASSLGVDQLREALNQQIVQVFADKFKSDPDFAAEYRDLRLDELGDQLIAWADRSYQRRFFPKQEIFPLKQAPFFSITELQMVPLVDDQIYDILSPVFSAGSTQGININTMSETLFKAITFNELTEEEIKAFFEFRDSPDQDNLFRTVDDYIKYLSSKTRAYGGDQASGKYRQNLAEKNIRLITEESEFRITITAQFNQASEVLIAHVSLVEKQAGSSTGASGGQQVSTEPNSLSTQVNNNYYRPSVDTGLRVRFMRFL